MLYAITVCAVAALSTGIGGFIVALCRNISDKTLGISQGFTAGVMLAVSFADMLPHCLSVLVPQKGVPLGTGITAVLFACGWLTSRLMAQAAVPAKEDGDAVYDAKRICFITTMVVVLHNLPEGMLTSFTGFEDRTFGMQMAFAIALHNIPEGIAVASAVMYVTGSKIKAIGNSFLAGGAELFGGAVSLLVLHSFVNQIFLAGLLAILAGVMTQVSVEELIPNGLKITQKKYIIYGIIVGAAIISLGMFII